jgi:hypothetical protein
MAAIPKKKTTPDPFEHASRGCITLDKSDKHALCHICQQKYAFRDTSDMFRHMNSGKHKTQETLKKYG